MDKQIKFIILLVILAIVGVLLTNAYTISDIFNQEYLVSEAGIREGDNLLIPGELYLKYNFNKYRFTQEDCPENYYIIDSYQVQNFMEPVDFVFYPYGPIPPMYDGNGYYDENGVEIRDLNPIVIEPMRYKLQFGGFMTDLTSHYVKIYKYDVNVLFHQVIKAEVEPNYFETRRSAETAEISVMGPPELEYFRICEYRGQNPPEPGPPGEE